MKCQHCGRESGQRTSPQNKAMHLFFRFLAEALNNAGLDMRKVLKPAYDMSWTTQTVKDHLWRPFQKTMLKKESTTELSKHEEITKVHSVLMRELGKEFGLDYIPFPDIHEIGGFCGKKSCPKCNEI